MGNGKLLKETGKFYYSKFSIVHFSSINHEFSAIMKFVTSFHCTRFPVPPTIKVIKKL
jgi:hypothetical protein